ncbi:MAG TPA: zinc-binding dehydrogenase, partial [Myxococcaceae bacterium]|nr:zinc-binding dehydrogenase [Myxococcaceae bacterium]
MRAIRVHRHGGPEELRCEEVERPAPGPGQILIRVAAAGINFADLMQRQGTYPIPSRLPMTPGLEVAGRIEVLGPGVTGLELGQRVMALTRGGYAEFALARGAQAVAIPEGLGDAEATALLVQGATARLLLEEAAPLKGGERVLVHAASGGVGGLLVQLARRMGAGQVIAAAGSAPKREFALSLGADLAVDGRDAQWVQAVREATGGRGADVVFEMVGGVVTAQSLECLAPYGRLVAFGNASGAPTTVDPVKLMFRNQSLIGFAITAVLPE